MATDDSDCYPTTSKFFKTQPSEFNSKQGESGEEISANYINILAAPKLFETNVTFSYEKLIVECRGKPVFSKYSIINELGTASPESPEFFFHLTNLIVHKLIEITGLKLLAQNYYYSFDKKKSKLIDVN
ncbi:unnamed protein product [Rotaria sordida]|uniref:Uncharacterized protein n=1 Tax=Rotaria sordida TaxID=392033 RepID=A0A819DAH0_9BILA|nr:unnamed protein product [Rotaria sordida]